MYTIILTNITSPEVGSKLFKCLRCGEWFATMRKVRYCSQKCRRRNWKKVGLEERKCSRCQTPFQPKNPLHIYCSTLCRSHIIEARRRERVEGRKVLSSSTP